MNTTRPGRQGNSRAMAAPLIAAIVAVFTLLLVAGCGSEPSSPPTSTNAQAHMPAPVSAHSPDPSTPKTLSIGSDSAPTDPVATDNSGVLLPPQDIDRLGWWADSSLPGSGTGTVVVTGHIDDVSQGKGFAAKFADLKAGDTVTLTTSDGHKHPYRVTTNTLAQKGTDRTAGDLPVAELNRQNGPETLALVTCGGPFIGPPLGYEDNVVVFAVPA